MTADYQVISNDINQLQKDINIISFWSCNTNILFNKAIYLQFWPRASTLQTKHCTKTWVLLLLTTPNGQGTSFKIISGKVYQTLGFLHHTLGTNTILPSEKQLIISLVTSQLLYSFQLWSPQLREKFILNHLTQHNLYKNTDCIYSIYVLVLHAWN